MGSYNAVGNVDKTKKSLKMELYPCQALDLLGRRQNEGMKNWEQNDFKGGKK